MIRETEIIVGTEIQHRALRDQNVRTLWAQNAPLGFMQALGADIGELGIQNLFERLVGHSFRET
jgi:hypothetical protein